MAHTGPVGVRVSRLLEVAMGGSKSGRTKVSRIIRASREVLYRAFLDPEALVSWLPPGGMTGKMHHFDARVGGTYVMSLYYPPDEGIHRGKTAAREDRITVCFVELSPPARIIEEVFFSLGGSGPGGIDGSRGRVRDQARRYGSVPCLHGDPPGNPSGGQRGRITIVA